MSNVTVEQEQMSAPASSDKAGRPKLRVAVNLLTDDPGAPSGAHWFWTRVIPEMAKRLQTDEELHLMVSPKSREHYQGYGPDVHYITYPYSNERRWAAPFPSTFTRRSGSPSAASTC